MVVGPRQTRNKKSELEKKTVISLYFVFLYNKQTIMKKLLTFWSFFSNKNYTTMTETKLYQKDLLYSAEALGFEGD